MSSKIIDKDRGWGALFERAKNINSAKVKVGVLADDAKGGTAHDAKSPLTVAELAALLQFGTERLPARPFLSAAFDEQRERLSKIGNQLLVAVLLGKEQLSRALNVMGSALATEVKKKITLGEGVPPPNAPATIARKGSDRPLVDTGRLLGAITWALEQKGK